MKTLSRKEIFDCLGKGDMLRYYNITAKVYVEADDGAIRGAVRFDTYLKLMQEKAITRIRSLYSSEIYALAA